MSSALPVPSKAALRTLRNLALGTTCTASIIAGLLTEDRRRRIHYLREVHENAKKLKNSRTYCSTGSAMVEDVFSEQVIVRRKSKSNSVPLQQNTDTPPSSLPPSENPQMTVSRPENGHSHSFSVKTSNNQTVHKHQCSPRRVLAKKDGPKKYSLQVAAHPNFWKVKKPKSQNQPERPEQPEQKQQRKQQEPNDSDLLPHLWQCTVADDINRILDKGVNASSTKVATHRLLGVLDERLKVLPGGTENDLVEAAARVSRACQEYGRSKESVRILIRILLLGPIDADCFHLFNPRNIIQYLLRNEANKQNFEIVKNLQKATRIYLPAFKDGSGNISEQDHADWLALGVELCARTSQENLPRLTNKIYLRLLNSPDPEVQCRAAQYYLSALHGLQGHHEAIAFFIKRFKFMAPTKSELGAAVSIALESAMIVNDLAKQEAVVTAALTIAMRRGLPISPSWILKTMGIFWRTSKDIVETRALFDRLEKIFGTKLDPGIFRHALIQFCIEAGDEETALMYANKPDLSPVPSLEKHAPTRLRFTLAKAMKNDWESVHNDLRLISDLVLPENQKLYSDTFVPIFVHFAKVHEIGETEEFLHLATQEYKVVLNSYLSNSMVHVYAQKGEVESMARWLGYASSVPQVIDATTFNIILSSCRSKWNFKFDDCISLYKSVRNFQVADETGKTKTPLVDQRTISILRRIALSEGVGKSSYRKNFMLKEVEKISPAHKPARYDDRKVKEDMELSLFAHDPDKALKVFVKAVQDRVSLHPSIVVLAVRASVLRHGSDQSPTVQLLNWASENGCNVTQAVGKFVVLSMAQTASDPKFWSRDVSQLVREISSSMAACRKLIPHAITYAAHVLVNRGYYTQAIELWRRTSQQESLPPSSLTLVTLTVLLRAYIPLKDLDGLNWVMRMVEHNNLVPDPLFRTYLKVARQRARQEFEKMDPSEGDPLYDYWRTINRVYEKMKELRTQVVQDQTEIAASALRIITDAAPAAKGKNARDNSVQLQMPDPANKPKLTMDYRHTYEEEEEALGEISSNDSAFGVAL